MSIRTTIVIDEDLLKKLRVKAGAMGVGLSRLISDLLTSSLASKPSGTDKPYRLEWPTSRGKLLPGVDLDNRDRLYDVMEGRR